MFHCALSFRGTVISWRRDKAGDKHTHTHTKTRHRTFSLPLKCWCVRLESPGEFDTMGAHLQGRDGDKKTTTTKRQIELQKQNIVNITNYRVGQRKPADEKVINDLGQKVIFFIFMST